MHALLDQLNRNNVLESVALIAFYTKPASKH